jgi:signal transduction histidine kinase
MLYALSLISDFDSARTARAIGVDLLMILTAIPGELVPSWHRWIFNAVSCAAFPYLFAALWRMFSAAIAEARGERASVRSLRALRAITVTFWTVFPLIWAAVQLDLLSLRAEEVLWSAADICGKIFFSSSLLHGNFMTIEHRKLAAMRVVEEANRARVIQELRAAVEQKESFINLMSHELRTPLNGIIGLSNALLSELPERGETARTLSAIRGSGARLLNLINDILDAAALRKGRLAVARNRVALGHAVGDVLELTAPLAKQGVRMASELPGDLPPVCGDMSRIVQVRFGVKSYGGKRVKAGI